MLDMPLVLLKKLQDALVSAASGSSTPKSSLAPRESRMMTIHLMYTPAISFPGRNTTRSPRSSELTHRMWAHSSISQRFTDIKQRIAEKRWQIKKYRRDTLENVETTLVTILNNAIDKSYHTGGTIMGSRGFGALTSPQIIARLQQNYGNPGIGEIKKAFLCLNNPIYQNMTIEVVLKSLKKVQMFLLASPEENRELT